MFVVERGRVGRVAFARLERDGAVHEVVGSSALAKDVQPTRALRAFIVSPSVPPHMWLTGLAALWVEGLCPFPGAIDLAGKRGLRFAGDDAAELPTRLHTGPVYGLPPLGVGLRVATTARACVDALAHSPAALALPATASGLRSGATTMADLHEALAAVSRHTTYKTRVADLVRALGELY